jgi:FtsH-binding integral membrane protein
LLFCGFIVWDTQMIIEKKRRGDGDYIGHSVELFIDFIQVFRKIVIILTSKVILISVYSILINLIYWSHEA